MVEPWSKFFWSDYEADEGLRVCSLAAQGLWMRMLCLMARATPKGELRIATEPCSVQDLAKLASESEETVGALLDELRRRGVFSVTRAGVIYNRRLRNDAIISRKRAESGAKGAAVTNGKYSTKYGLPRQNPGKPPGKSPAPEARSQIPDSSPPPDLALNPRARPEQERSYAFEGSTIRLTTADFDRWRASYGAIPDLKAELSSLDDWFKAQPPERRKNWFHTVSGSLSRKHQEFLVKAQRGEKDLVDVILERGNRLPVAAGSRIDDGGYGTPGNAPKRAR